MAKRLQGKQGRPTRRRAQAYYAASSSQVILATPYRLAFFSNRAVRHSWGNAHTVFGPDGSDLTKTTNQAATAYGMLTVLAYDASANPAAVEVVVIHTVPVPRKANLVS
jgi:hypothetical protein